MGKEPADVSTAFEQYQDNINKIKENIDGIIDRLVENFDNIHTNPVVQKQIDDGLTRMKEYLDIHIPWHKDYNELIKCFPSLYDRSKKIVDKLIILKTNIEELLLNLASAKEGDDSIYHEKIIPKLREIVKQYREISLINELKQCLETIIIKPLTFMDERIIHPLKIAVIEFMGTSPEKVPTTPPIEEVALAEIMQRIASTIPQSTKGGGKWFSRRRRNKQNRRKKTRKNIHKKLNGLY
jgi:hypothetical protein